MKPPAESTTPFFTRMRIGLALPSSAATIASATSPTKTGWNWVNPPPINSNDVPEPGGLALTAVALLAALGAGWRSRRKR